MTRARAYQTGASDPDSDRRGCFAINDDALYVGDSYSEGVFVHTAAVILWDEVALSAYSESAS